MRLAPSRLEWLGIGFAVAIAAVLLLPQDNLASRHPDSIDNELCIVAPASPYDPASGLAMLEARPVPASARCPVCGMYPARHPRWAAQIIFKEGSSHHFDSPVDLFVFLQRVERYNRGRTLDDVAVSYVTDFETGQSIDAKTAWFVYGSSAFGPMRNADLPAFSSRESATSLTRSKGGKVLLFNQITPDLLQHLNHNVHHAH